MVEVIPREVEIDKVFYQNIPEIGLVVTDGKEYRVDVSEFSALR